MKTTLSLTVLTILTILLICGGQRVADAQFFDGDWEGFVIGGGVGYTTIVGENIESAAGFTTFGRVGYGFSDEFILYFSSPLRTIAPTIGFLYSPNRRAPYYFQGALGYTTSEEDSLLSLSGGFGYKLHDHIMLELSVGIHRFTETYTHYDWWTGNRTVSEHTDIATFAAIFNFLLY